MRDLWMVWNARLRVNLWPLQCAEQAQLRHHYAAKVTAAQLTMRPAQAAAEIARLISEKDAALLAMRTRHRAERENARGHLVTLTQRRFATRVSGYARDPAQQPVARVQQRRVRRRRPRVVKRPRPIASLAP